MHHPPRCFGNATPVEIEQMLADGHIGPRLAARLLADWEPPDYRELGGDPADDVRRWLRRRGIDAGGHGPSGDEAPGDV